MMKKAKFRANVLRIFLLSVSLLFAVFFINYVKNAEEWAFYETNGHIYTDGKFTAPGKITDRNGVVLSQTVTGKRVYNENADIRKATIHAVGDHEGFISTGVINAKRSELVGYSPMNGIYTYSGKGNNAQLTIDSQISAAAMRALGDSAGCVGVCNYKTGEIICMVSTPTYDINDENEYSMAKNGEMGSVFINRFISSAYTPGSTFKIITAAAAIEALGQKAYDTSFVCDYGTVIENEKLNCMGRHKTVSMNNAFCHSCNAYFSNMALYLGKRTMTEYAEKLGFNSQFSIDGIMCAPTSYSVEKSRNIDFGWSGIGQHTNLMNPVQYLCMVSAIANGGEYIQPYFVASITDSNGNNIYSAQKKAVRMIETKTAEQLSDLMDYAVKNNYGKSTFNTLDVCGKTGTAEVGEKIENSLFVGFCKDNDLPLAFVVVAEGDQNNKKSAISIAAKTLQAAKKYLKKQ